MENNMLIKNKLANLRKRAVRRKAKGYLRSKDASLENDNFNSLAKYVYLQASDADREKS